MMGTFAGKPYDTIQDLARLALANPQASQETFRVAGEYGNVPHGHLELERVAGFGDLDETGVMAYEDLLIGAIRCVGTDYIEYAAAQGVEVDSVRLEVEGKWDVRGLALGFNMKVPSAVRSMMGGRVP
jgi:hypothetical protein